MSSKSDTAAWASKRANEYKSGVGMCGILNGVIAFVGALFILWFSVPFLPPSLADYGWLFHLPHAVLWGPCLAVSGSKSRELLSLVAIVFALPALLLDAWAFFINLLPWFIGCVAASPVSFTYDCIVTFPYMFVLFILGGLFFLTTLFIFYNVLALISYLNRVADANGASLDPSKDE